MISSLQRGGAEAVLYELVKKLDGHQFEQSVIYFHQGLYTKKIKDLGIKVYSVKGFFCLYDPIFFYRLILLLKKLKPSCLHTVLWSAGFVGRMVGSLLSIKTVHALHNTVDHNGLIKNILDRLSSKLMGDTIAVSETVAHSVVQRAPWIKGHSVHVIKNGINQEQITQWSKQEKRTRKELGLDDSHFIVGAVGRFEHVKNYGLLLTSFALLYDDHPQARLVLIGSGKLEYLLRKRAFDLGIDDRVLFVVGQSAYGYYPLFDCYVSTSFYEGLSIALLEAMSFGLPCVITHSEQSHEVIKHEKNGLLVSSENVYQLALALGRYITDRNLSNKLGKAAKKLVEKDFKAESMIENYTNFYTKFSSRKRAQS